MEGSVRTRLNRALGKLIRQQRESLNWNQEHLAQEVGISRTSLTNIELGRQRVTVDLLYRIAEALGIEPKALLPEVQTGQEAGRNGAPSIKEKEIISAVIQRAKL